MTRHTEEKFANLPLIPCVIYVRTDLNDGSRFDEQSRRCMAFAAGNGLSVRALYSDTAEPGMGINPGLQRMREDARAGRLDCLVVESVDQLSRSLPIGLSILSELEASGVKERSIVGKARVEPVARTRNAKRKPNIDGEKKPAVRKQQTG